MSAFRAWLPIAVACLTLLGCGSPIIVVEPRVATPALALALRAGVAEVDITPPTGAPLFGYSWGDVPAARGYWTRLEARVLALEGSRGERVALVQADLGAVSALVQREVARRTAEIGISADRLLIAATHTHAGPGGYFGQRFFNFFGAGKPGFDPQMVEFLVSRITRAVQQAFTGLAPAALGATAIDVPDVTRNRSREARWNDFASPCLAEREPDVDDMLRLLRVDRIDGAHSTPLAALFVFAVHGTSIDEKNDLYHGDLHAVAARALGWKLARQHPAEPAPLVAFMNGTEGDVSPAYSEQGQAEAIRLGTRIAERAFQAFQSLDGQLDPNPQISHAYEEIVLPSTVTREGFVCRDAEVGVPTLAGAEDGRSFLYGKFGIYEGARRITPEGCQSYKLPAFGPIQSVIMPQERAPGQSLWHFFDGNADPGSFPRIAPFQVIRLGTAMTLVTVPGEPTTELGRRIRQSVAPALGQGPDPLIAVVGLANEYLYYFTTPGEFRAQHYEGGSTLYGPLQGLAAEEQILRLVKALDGPSAPLYYGRREFLPGPATHFWSTGDACRSDAWAILDTQVEPARNGGTPNVVVSFKGIAEGADCSYPTLRVRCGGSPLLGPEGVPEDDHGYRFELRRVGSSEWKATFHVPRGLKARGCRVEIVRPAGAPLQSKEFDL